MTKNNYAMNMGGPMLEWNLDTDGTLRIKGSGNIDNRLWSGEKYKIKRVIAAVRNMTNAYGLFCD